jgi:hypothetical protein
VVLLDSCQQLEVNISIMNAICQYFKKSNVYYIPHPDDAYEYEKMGISKANHSTIKLDNDVLIGNNSSVVLQYGRLGAEVLLFNESFFAPSCHFDGKPMLPKIIIDELSFIHIDYEASKLFWNYYIRSFGDECLANIASEVA